jgi:hypothetical protein
VSVALHHYMCFEVIAHHVPHTTVPANRPHRPVSAPPQRSPLAETGQPVRTQFGVRGRRLARRLHPCASAVRPPFYARRKWSSAMERWALQECAVPPRGTAGKGPTFRRKRFPGREEGRAEVTAAPARPGPSRSRSVLRKKSRGRSIQYQSCAHRTGKEADRQTCRMVSMQPCCGSARHPQRHTVAWPSDQPCRQVLRPVTYAGMQTCKPPYGPEGQLPRLQAGLRAARAPRRSITAAGILRKHEGLGEALQLPAHPV